MANPADMTDEELDKVIETGVEPEEPSPEVETPDEPAEAEESKEEPEAKEEEVESPEPEANVEEEAIEEKEEQPQPSRREQLRVQQLLAKYGPPKEKAPSQPNNSGALNYETALEADPEVIKQLEADRQAYSDHAYQQGLQQGLTREWRRDLKYEAPLVEKEYPFLNPKDTENFKPAAADAMNVKYLNFVGYDPGDPQNGIPESVRIHDLSYKEFVDSEMEFVNELASQKAAESVKNITKQAAQTGLRPDGSAAKMNLNKPAHEMTDEELEAKLKQVGLGTK